MRSIVAVIICACCLQAVWLSLSNGEDIACSSLQEKSECCSSNASCVFVNCTSNGVAVTSCFDNVTEASCDDAAQAVDTCGKETVTEADSGTTEKTTETETAATGTKPIDCTQLDGSRSQCCAAVNADNSSACIFFKCTDDKGEVTGTECAAADTAPKCPEKTDTPSDNKCRQEAEGGEATGTTGTSANTENNGKTTQATTGEAVDCATVGDDKEGCCSAGNATACIFFNCTDTEGNVRAMCAAATTTPECTSDETASGNICEESGSSTTPSGSENPSQAPASGGEDGGQNFDAASFIGGIVLCAGVLAIAFFGLKFYRSRQERNYQSM